MAWSCRTNPEGGVRAACRGRARLAPLVGRGKRQGPNAAAMGAARPQTPRIRLLGRSRRRRQRAGLRPRSRRTLRARGLDRRLSIRPNDPDRPFPLRRARAYSWSIDYPEEQPDEVRTLLREVGIPRACEMSRCALLVLSRPRAETAGSISSKAAHLPARLMERAGDRFERTGGG